MTANSYEKMGASSTKSDVKDAIKGQSTGVFTGTFCKIIEDINCDSNYCSAIHADGTGTKSVLAYIHASETGDNSVFKGIAQDSAVMNLDDLLCIGATNNFVLSNTIGRNAHLIQKEVIEMLINGYQEFTGVLSGLGIEVTMAGGETADIGDIVRTIVVDSTIYTRLERDRVINASNIRPGNIIIGLASFGKASYETAVNSGIGSNGFTRARHLLLSNYYKDRYPETFSPTIDSCYIYQGNFMLEDELPDSGGMTIGQALLSPTRTYLPPVKAILGKYFDDIAGIIHCSGGGATKSINFGAGLHYVKNNLFETPAIFRAILDSGELSMREAFQVFNMGQRMELYVNENSVDQIIEISKSFGVYAQVIGRVEKGNSNGRNSISITHDGEEFNYFS